MTFSLPPAPHFPRVNWDPQERAATFAKEAPRMPWEVFTTKVFHAIPGKHVGIIGPTGQGKTVLMQALLPFYPFVAVFATKPADVSMDRLIEHDGYTRFAQWIPMNPQDIPRRVIWPDARTLGAAEKQQQVFHDAMEHIFREGGRPRQAPVGWAVGIDEVMFFSEFLKLGKDVKLFWIQGRSLGITMIAATQRPFFVPTEMYSMSTHLFLFKDTDENNLRRIGEINAGNKRLVREIVQQLDEHQVLYVNTRTGVMARTRTPVPLDIG